MTNHSYPHPMLHDISITLTIYDNWQQVTRRAFPLRNLEGQTEAEQVAHARQIMDEVAVELHYLTNLGVDKGFIRCGGRKADEAIYPSLKPPPTVKWFIHGVNIAFHPLCSYGWKKDGQVVWRVDPEKRKEGWELCQLDHNKRVGFRLPVNPASQGETEPFFKYVHVVKKGRKKTGWYLRYNANDPLFRQFVSRFHDDGHLCIGDLGYWAASLHPAEISGVFWPLPKFGAAKKAPRKTQIASQPTDNTDYVYLIRMGRTKMYKIGKTNDPNGRLASLQTASPYKLKLLHTFKADNASAAEETLHAHFQAARLEGEWFTLAVAEQKALLSVTEYKDGRFWTHDEGLTLESLFI